MRHPLLTQILEENKLDESAAPNLAAWNKFLTQLNFHFIQSASVPQGNLAENLQKYVLAMARLTLLSKMVGGVAHEINTPLAVVQMRTDQMIDSLQSDDLDKESLSKGLASIELALIRVSEIVKKLRTFARIKDEELVSQVSLRKVIENTVILIRDRFTLLKVSLEIIDGEDFELLTKPIALSQVLICLLNNSLEAAANSEDKWVRVTLNSQPESFQIKVSNSGPGIDPKIQNQMMNPFFTTKEKNGNLGLGLNTAKELALLMNANIAYDSSALDCTQFIIYINK